MCERYPHAGTGELHRSTPGDKVLRQKQDVNTKRLFAGSTLPEVPACGGELASHFNLQRQESKVGSEVMITFTVKTHREGNRYRKPHLFALSRGYNTGRPLREPCPNCFVILMESETACDQMYFLLDGLWRRQVFRVQLIGSVIPFLRVHEFTKTIFTFWRYIQEDEERVKKLIDAFHAVEKLEKHHTHYMQLLSKFRQVAYANVFDLTKIKQP